MQDRARRTRSAVLGAAADLVNESRYSDATLATIAQRAGVSKGALYFHFASKEALCDALRDDAARVQRELISASAAEAGAHSPYQLIVFARALTGRIAADPLFRAGLRLAHGTGTEAEPDGLRGEWRRFAVEQLAGAGARPPGAAARTGAELLTALLAGVEELARGNPSWLDGPALERLWAAVLPSLTFLALTD